MNSSHKRTAQSTPKPTEGINPLNKLAMRRESPVQEVLVNHVNVACTLNGMSNVLVVTCLVAVTAKVLWS